MNRRAAKGESYEPTYFEHVANVTSHGIVILPSVLVFHFIAGHAKHQMQFYLMLVYGLVTTCLFVASTMHHICDMLYRPLGGRRKLRYFLHITDRAVIYLFIAASYTPWLCLRDCGSPSFVWALAVFGILYQYNFHEKYKTIELCLYIAVAGLPSLAIYYMHDRSGLDLMIYGGIVYVVGVVFFKMDGVIPFAHAIWHVHVLIGAAIHTYAVYSFLILNRADYHSNISISQLHGEL